MVRKLTLGLLFLLVLISLYAIPAYPNLIDFKQPDNSTIKIKMYGDEKVRFAETEDGYTILFNAKGFYEYAQLNQNGELVCSNKIAKNPNLRSSSDNQLLFGLEKHLRYSEEQKSLLLSAYQIRDNELNRSFPPTGNRKLIMILIGFTDKAFVKTQTDFNNLMNQVNYSASGAHGSVKDWFADNSFDLLNLTTDIAGPFTASNTMAYYGGNSGGSDARPRELVTEAVNLANSTVDFSEYDNDNDGAVDGVYVIFAGYGEEAGGGSNCIWSHAWSIPTVSLDGVTISRYSCSPELSGSSGSTITNIGVICHEFSHVCGLPDFYDTDYEGSGGQSFDLGDWDPMAGGSWNDNGRRPPYHNTYSRSALGWQTQTVLSSPAQISIQNSEIQTVSYRFNSSTTNEYFVVENRQNSSWDTDVPHHGMLIYHVDKNWSGWSNNRINATPTHQGMDIEEADNSQSSSSLNGDPFPGSSNKTVFNDSGNPNSHSWAGANTAKPITNIVESNGVISFDFMGGDIYNPTAFTAQGVSVSQIDLNWTPSASASEVIIAVNSTNSFGNLNNGTAYSVGQSISGGGQIIYSGNATSFSHTALNSGTTYYYKIWARYNTNNYSSGRQASASTLLPPLLLPYAQDFNASANLPVGWSIVDIQGSNQVWQIGTFVAGLQNSGNYAYVNSDGYGSGGIQNTDLISPLFDLSGYTSVTLQFKHYFKSYSGSSAKLYYSINNGQNWALINTWTTDTSNGAIYTQAVNNTAGQANVRFKWTYQGSYAWYWCVDDISLTGVSGTVVSNFSANTTTVYQNNPVIFTANCSGPITSYLWNFGQNATPQTANTVGPHTVTYSTTGTKTVSLTVNGSVTETKNNYITVLQINSPQNLTAAAGNATVSLNWQAPQNRTLTSYKIYRNGTLLQTVASSVLSYTDNAVTNGTQYTYYITALFTDPNGESLPSNSVTVTPLAPVLNPPQNLSTQVNGLSIVLSWDMNATSSSKQSQSLIGYDIFKNNANQRNLLNFKIYRNNTQIALVSPTDLYYIDRTPPFGALSYYATAVYSDGESDSSNVVNMNFENPNLFAPTSIMLSKMANHVSVKWPFATSQTWIHWGNSVASTFVGNDYAYNVIGTIRFTQTQIEQLGIANKRLKSIRYRVNNLSHLYNLYIWQGGQISPMNPGNNVYFASNISPTNIETWNYHVIDDTLTIDPTQELWIGIEVISSGGPSLGIDNTPMVTGFGNLLYYYDSWTTLYNVNNTLNKNWLIQGEVDLESYPLPSSVFIDNSNLPSLTTDSTRDINVLGYNLYRNNQLLNATPLADTINYYFDPNLPNDFYTYSVKTVYADGESQAISDTISINKIVIDDYPYSDSFEGDYLSRDWYILNNDNDDYCWYQFESTAGSHSGQNAMISQSYDEAVGNLSPDNWLISPCINLPQINEYQYINLTYWVTAVGPNQPVEHYAVKLSNQGSLVDQFSYNLLDENISSTVWTQKCVNLNQFAGQSVNIAFRHFNVTGQYAIKLDDFVISEPLATNENNIPLATKINQNYPNPFNPSTTIEYSIKNSSKVSLEIYNVKGQKINTLINTSQKPGKYRVIWNGKDYSGKDLASGIYFCKLKTQDSTSAIKLMMIK
jgi:M6 family metalloprotease-like protein